MTEKKEARKMKETTLAIGQTTCLFFITGQQSSHLPLITLVNVNNKITLTNKRAEQIAIYVSIELAVESAMCNNSGLSKS